MGQQAPGPSEDILPVISIVFVYLSFRDSFFIFILFIYLFFHGRPRYLYTLVERYLRLPKAVRAIYYYYFFNIILHSYYQTSVKQFDKLAFGIVPNLQPIHTQFSMSMMDQ